MNSPQISSCYFNIFQYFPGVIIYPASVSAGEGTGGGVSATTGGNLPAPSGGAPQQRSPKGRPVLAPVQSQQPQPQLRLGTALQLLHALLPVNAQPQHLEQEHGQ